MRERGPLPLAAALAIPGSLVAVIVVLALAVALEAQLGALQAAPSNACEAELRGVPAPYADIYAEASSEYGLGSQGPPILAAIHKVESDFGRLAAPGVASGENHAGAGGPMQFLAATWAAYGVDANGDGRADRYDPEDAIHGAANYLRASGAPGDWRGAIFAYNHAGWYVADVLALAERFQGAVSCEPGGERVEIGDLDFGDTSGAWGGAKKFADVAKRLAARQGCSVVSAKRDTVSTASGGISDHWSGAKHSFAYDLNACPFERMDESADAIAAAFALPADEGVVSLTRGRYRLQLLWKTMVGGDHFTHVHFGVRNLCCGS